MLPLQPRLEQDEFAIAGDEKIDHLRIAVAGFDPLPHQNAQIVGERRLRLVDQFVLTDQAAQFLGDRAGARFEFRVRQHFVGLDGPDRERPDERDEQA